MVLSEIAARRITGVTAGTLAAVCVGTPLVFYMYVAPGFSHANSAFAVAGIRGGVALRAGATGARRRGSPRRPRRTDGMVREQDLFIALGPRLTRGDDRTRGPTW